MCGVMGYVGKSASAAFFLQGLKRLEYRGYDSSGIAMLYEKEIYVSRAAGKLCNLEKKLSDLPKEATVGIGHTRWATHGKPTEFNAHPHRSGSLALLHNGIIENYKSLKKELEAKGYHFQSDTDTEVALHLIHQFFEEKQDIVDLEERLKRAIIEAKNHLEGAYAFAIICEDLPHTLFAVKEGSPLILGKGKGENYIASAVAALVDHTDLVAFLEDGDVAILKPESIAVQDKAGSVAHRPFRQLEWSNSLMEKNGYTHYMLKELHEHPQSVANLLSRYLKPHEYRVDKVLYGIEGLDLGAIDKIHIVACGSSYYAALVGKSLIEEWSHLPVEVELSSEYRYKYCTATPRTLIIAVSQSGETADTLQAVKLAASKGAVLLAIVNMVHSSLADLAHYESRLHAGPEIGVASTKAFSAQVLSLMLCALLIGREKKVLSDHEEEQIVKELLKLPTLMEKVLSKSEESDKIAEQLLSLNSLLFIGRGISYPIAMEGALKMKEISYIHAEGYAAGELKHGPIALIDEEMVVISLAPQDPFYEKTISNILEIKARGGKILAIGEEKDEQLSELADYFLSIPAASSFSKPLLITIFVHLLAYHVAVRRGNDVDQPRNLAKSVTVE